MSEGRRPVLVVATVAQSLVFQSPSSWCVLRSRGYDLVFACGRDSLAETLQRWGEVRDLPLARSLSPVRLMRSLQVLRRLLDQDWALVQVQTPIAAALVRLIRPCGRRSPVVYVVHGYHFDPRRPTVRSSLARLVERVLLDRTDVLAAVSEDDYRWAATRARRAQVCRLPGAGIDVARFSAPQPPVTATCQPFHLFCGELNANKDPMFAIAVVRAFRRLGHDHHLVVIGSGPLADLVRAAQAKFGWVHWVPHTDSVERYLHSAVSLLAPSWREGLPRVIIEAFASGTPVIARDNRGSRELLCGLLPVMPAKASTQDWAHQLDELLARPVDRRRLYDRATRYDEANFVSAYRAVIDRAVGGAAAARL